MNKDIARCSKRIEELDKKLDKQLKKKKNMESIYVVKNYIRILRNISRYIKERNELYKEYEKLYLDDCEHSLWYYISEEVLLGTDEKLLKCSCLKCGKTKIARKNMFPGDIIGLTKKTVSFEEARDIYQNLKNQNSSDEEIKIFVKSFFE